MNENEMKNERNEMSIQILNILIDSLVSIALKSTNDNYCRICHTLYAV